MEIRVHAGPAAGESRRELVPGSARRAVPSVPAPSQQEAELVDFLLHAGPFRERLARTPHKNAARQRQLQA